MENRKVLLRVYPLKSAIARENTLLQIKSIKIVDEC